MANKFIFAITSLLIFSQLKAATCTTAVSGNWSNQGCWANGAIPSFNNSDTIIINHFIILPANLTLLNGAHLFIESTGGICGHVYIFMNTGSSILKYGILEIDALDMTGGIATLLPPGNTIFTQYGQLSGSAELINTSNLSVGPWFECQMPEYQFVNGLNSILKNEKINTYPNPTNKILNIDLPKNKNNYLIKVIDSKGTLAMEQQLIYNQNQLDISALKQGMYFIEIISDKSYFTAKFCKK